MTQGKAVSSGGLVLREIDGVLHIALAREPDKGPNAWVLPKGHLKQDETLEEAALREIAEEVGLTNVQLVTYLGTIVRESREDSGETVLKTIHVFLAYALAGATTKAEGAGFPVPPEMKWFTVPDACEVIPFKEDREFVKDRLRYLKGKCVS